ncbi:MAG: FAD-dependent oxidoreductase [Deltaproteobacteria bacterium]|nr:FAD-dependent oxidoreductase [Deltaproteobacteria bacterium]
MKDDRSIFGRPVSRRAFLAAGAAGAAALALPGCGVDNVYTDDYPNVPENHVRLPKHGKSVLILGGGFGGMHAACELVDRGFDVTIIEKSDSLGGKLKSWRDPGFGVPPENAPLWKGYPRDHGAHAVWGFYNNLREFMGRHGYTLWKMPSQMSMYNFLDRDGTNALMGGEETARPGFFARLRSLEQARRAFSIIAGEEIPKNAPFLRKMLSFDFSSQRQRMALDAVSFPEWARSVGMPDRLIYRFFGPTSEMAMFDHIDNTSALYTLMLMSLGTGSPADMVIDVFMHPPGETYVAPIERYIKSLGGKILYDTPVIRVNVSGGRVMSVTAGDEQAKPGVKQWKCGVCGSVFDSPTKPNRCPVCGAPAIKIRPLSAKPPAEYTADYYLVAMDTEGAREFVGKSRLGGDSYFDNIMKLSTTGVFPVNLWYHNCRAWEKRFPRHIDFFPSSFKLLGITLNWAFDGTIDGKKVCEPIVPEYGSQNINVIETQIAATERVENADDDLIAKMVHEELSMVIPDLPDPTDWYVNRWTSYSPQRVGYEALRPPIQSPVENLLFIGDWVRTDHESVYMEKTCVAAKMATNILLDHARIRDGKIKILKSGTPSALVNLVRLLESPLP